MAGLLNSPMAAAGQPAPAAMATPQQAPAQGMSPPSQTSLADPILQKIETGIQSKIAPQAKSMFISCVNAGMSAMFGPQTGKMVIAKLNSSQNLTADIPTGVANIFAMIYNEVGPKLQQQQRQQIFIPAMLAAAAVLACHALDTAEKLGRIKVTPQIAGQVIHDSAMACLAKLKIGPQQIQQATQQGQSPNAAAQGQQPPAAAPAQGQQPQTPPSGVAQ